MEHGNVLSLAQGEFTIAHSAGKADPGNAVPSLLLLFPRGRLPDGASLRAALARAPAISVSLDHGDIEAPLDHGADHAAKPSSQEDGPWFECVAGALTFDLRGFLGGTSDAHLAQSQQDRLANTVEFDRLGLLDSLILRVSPHLAAGAMASPVLHGLCAAGSHLGAQFTELAGFGWPDSGAVYAADRFHSVVEHWAQTGTLPVDFFNQFRDELDRGLASRGLTGFIGQELRLEPELVEDRSTAERLGQRLAAQLIPMGELTEPQDFAMPDGRNLRLEPSKNGRFVRAFLR